MLPLPLRRPLTSIALLLAAMSSALAAESTTAPAVSAAADSVFAYDREASFDLKVVGTEQRDGVVIRDVTFAGRDAPVTAYIVAPAEPAAGTSLAGILYVHWLGEPSTTNRTEFLSEAIALAPRGIVSVLVDAMWARPKWYPQRVPENDYADAVRQVIDLRRAMDLLVAQPGVDAQRIAFVGHDFGAMYGMISSALDRRARTYVFMAGVPHFIDWFLFAAQPKDPDAYRRQIAPLDPVRFVARLAPAPVFFQFASHDEYVSAAAAAEFYAAAGPRKQCATYDAGHDLHRPEVAADRVAWLLRELAPARTP